MTKKRYILLSLILLSSHCSAQIEPPWWIFPTYHHIIELEEQDYRYSSTEPIHESCKPYIKYNEEKNIFSYNLLSCTESYEVSGNDIDTWILKLFRKEKQRATLVTFAKKHPRIALKKIIWSFHWIRYITIALIGSIIFFFKKRKQKQ